MAIPGQYRLNPQTGAWEGTQPGNMGISGTAEDVSGGLIRHVGGNRYQDLSTGRITSIGTAMDPIITTYRNGGMELVSQTLGNPGALYPGDRSTFAIGGSINITRADGSLTSVPIDVADLFAYGGRVYVGMDDQGGLHYDTLIPGGAAYNEFVNAYPAGVREATYDEVVEYALSGYLLSHEQRLIEELVREEGFDASGEAATTFSGQLHRLAQLSIQDIQPFKITRFGPAPGGR